MSRRVWFIYLLAVAIYISLSFLAPVDSAVLERYNISTTQLALLRLTVVLPLVAIWFAAFYGYDKFRNYAEVIQESPDGKAFVHIANGLGVLALSLPATSIVSSVFDLLTRDSEGALPSTTIAANYLAVALALAAFWFLYKGSKMLLRSIAPRADQKPFYNATLFAIAVLAVVYTYFTFQNPVRRVPTEPIEEATYYLPDPLILVTIVVPYLLIWYLGLRSAAFIAEYARSVKGILYKQVLGFLAKGLVAIILLSITLQFLGNFATWFGALSLAPILVIVYLLLIAIAVGYAYVAAGAKKLQKIEEV